MKDRKERWGYLAALVVVALVTSGCASSTLIESRPAGATVTLDGEYYVGETPLRVRDMPWIMGSRDYQFTAEGHYPRVIQIKPRRSGAHTVACMCTLGLLWPLMLFGEFPEDLVVSLQREQPLPRAEFEREPLVDFGG